MIRNLPKLLLLLLTVGLGVSPATGQNRLSPALQSLTAPGSEPGWLLFNESLHLDAKTLFSSYKSAFDLGEKDEMVLFRVHSDELGYTHYRYQQTYGGVPVEGAEFALHSRNGIAIKGNGHLQPGLSLNYQPAVSPENALATALSSVAATSYMWESAGNQEALRQATGDPDASFFPAAELLIADDDFQPQDEPDFHLLYKFDIQASQPVSRTWVYVDAHNGEVVKSLDMLMHTDSAGTAETRYKGNQPIVAEGFTDTGGFDIFRLRESGRGSGIETYNLNTSTDYADAVDFIDPDNYWESDSINDASTDAHWAAELTYDYYLGTHGRDSYDDEGSKLISYVHYDVNYFNAFWNGQWATFGDGSGDPLTTVDITAHEFTHGVTGNSARLVYAYESGALNESFSDIFGNAVEYYADPATFDWKIGEDIGAFRNMENPQEFGDPDTYRGTDWWTQTGDNGGVHINSGVQNYWFYLLVEGGSGTNGIGQSYAVNAIGWEAASAIAYRNLNVYLDPSSQFKDARAGSLQAVEDLYGFCSDEYTSVAAAWHAVGIGNPVTSQDFGVVDITPLGDCGLSNEEEISIKIRYLGCDTISIPFIQVAYFIQNTAIAAVEVIPFTQPVMGGQLIEYTFQTKADLSAFGNYAIVARTLTATDPYQQNDSSEFITARNPVSMRDDTLTFESFAVNTEVLDSLYLEDRRRSSVRILPGVGQDSSFAIRMTGDNYFAAAPPDSGQDFFDTNPAFSGFVYFCVDAEELNELYLDFDLRQTFSSLYDTLLGESNPGASSFRVLADGVELARYLPTTNDADPFTRQQIDLSAYAGTKFQLVMESKAISSLANDPDSIGDNIFLDNIRFRSVTWPTRITPALSPSFSLFPNPSTGMITLELEAEQQEAAVITVRDMMGKQVQKRTWQVQPGENRLDLSLADLAPGMYLISLQQESGISSSKVRRE